MASIEMDELKPERRWEACAASKLYYKLVAFAKNIFAVLRDSSSLGWKAEWMSTHDNGLNCSGIAGLREQVIHRYMQSQ